MGEPLRTDAKLLAAAFTGSGVVHLVNPDFWETFVPAQVPAHRAVILGSGVAELVCAAGILVPPTRRVAGYASAALLCVVFVGNLKVAHDASRSGSRPARIGAYARLPMQLPMIRAALRIARARSVACSA